MAYNISNTIKTPAYSSFSNKSGNLGYTAPTGGSSPAAMALNNKAQTSQPAPTWQSTLNNVMSSWKPTAPIKKVVQSNADGSSTETHFDNNTKTDPLIKPNLAGGGLTPEQKAAGDAYTTKLNSGTDNSNLTGGATLPSNAPLIDPTFAGMTSGASALAQGNLNIAQDSTKKIDDISKQIADVGQQGLNVGGGYGNSGVGNFGPGNEARIAQTTAAKQSQLEAEKANILTGTAQQLTAQNQAQTGVLGAANLAQKTGNFPFVFDPLTGQFTTAGATGGATATNGISFTGNPTNDAQTAAQAVMSRKMTYQQAQQSMSYAGNTANNYLNSAILASGGDPLKLEASGAATQSNIKTTNTAQTNAANSGYSSAIKEYQDNTASYTALTGISDQVASTLGNYANMGTLTDVNAAINTLQGKLSNPDYQKFITAIGNAQAAYQGILGSSGVTPTKADQDAVNALNPNSSASTIVAALNQLSSDAHALIIAPTYQKVQNYKQQLGIK